MNAFATWLAKSKLKASELSESLGVSDSTVYNLRNGYFTPGRELAVLIAKVSKGKVPADSWPPARPRKASPPKSKR